MSLDLFILTPLINLEDRELCIFPNTLEQEKQMLPAETERAVDKLVEMVVSIKRIGQQKLNLLIELSQHLIL